MTPQPGSTQIGINDFSKHSRFTNEDTDKIREYVTYGLDLPVVLQAVEVFVGYKTASAPGLEPADLRVLFTQVRDNAAGWNDTGDMIGRQTRTLASMAASIVQSGESLIAAVKGMPFYVRMSATLGSDLGNLPSIDIPNEALGAADISRKRDLLGQLEALRKVNLEQVDGTEAAMRGLAAFRSGIETLEPVVAAKRAAIKKSNLEKIGNEITVEPMIAALQREYELAAQRSGRGAAIVEAKRKELEGSIQVLKSQMDVYRGRQRVTYAMGRLFAHFTELGMIMVDAEMAVGHLWLAWKETSTSLENSSAGFAAIDTSRKLVTFLSDFQIIIGNWNMVQNRARELNRAF